MYMDINLTVPLTFELLWRNRLARMTVNHKVPSSSLGGSDSFWPTPILDMHTEE